MARGFAVNADGSYAGWGGHEDVFELQGFPKGVVFIPDDDEDPRVSDIRAERDAPPPPGPPSVLDDLITLAQTETTLQEKALAQIRIDSRPKPRQS